MRRTALLVICAIAASIGLQAQSIYLTSDHEASMTPKAYSVPLQDVRLLPSRWRDNMQRDSAWLMSLPVKSIVHSFRNTVGVRTDMNIPKLGGWEKLDCELRGHSVGHMMSALALIYAQTGEQCFKEKGDSIVTALSQVQRAYGNGYLSAFGPEQIERNIRGEGVWAPFYTIHKIMAGLLDQYVHAGNSEALEMVSGMTEWAWNRLHGLTEEERATMLRNEFGGVNESFYNVYSLTGNEHALEMARFFYHKEAIDPLKENRDELAGLHANTFIPKILAEARNYELNGDISSKAAVENGWDIITRRHCYATGCFSDREHFFDSSQFDKHLSGYTGEECCTYNMLKLTRHLFSWSADPMYADYYENALLNHMLGQQDPETGMIHYFQPMQSGAYKLYSTSWGSFWCCVGSSFESHAKYGEAIYYQSEYKECPLLYVNLFIPSVLQWRQAGLTIKQETSFPYGESTVLEVRGNATASIALRIPGWAQDPYIKINGKNVRMSVQNGYQIITRKWKDGDRIELSFPMKLTVEFANGSSERFVLRYGPIVLGGELGTEGITSIFSDPSTFNDFYFYDYKIPDGLPVSMSPDLDGLQRTGALSWKIGDTTISPLFDIHHQRYVVYWAAAR